ncbi:MAG: DEAD/DEAH box helicase [Bdellovibrionia bacterium]
MKNFKDFDLSSFLLQALDDLGFEKPSPIQAETLPILLGEPTDFLGLAATGTGKTAAFSIPLLQKIDPSLKKLQALILCPTRELALQVSEQINLLGKYKGIRALPIYGGSDYGAQIRGLKDGAKIVVGTPGRLVDHLERGTLNLENVQTVVLDEADEMISMGFKEDLETLLDQSPRESSQTWLFSATLSKEVRKVADQYLRNPQEVQMNRTEMLAQNVQQLYYITQESNKPEILCKLIDAAEEFYGILFCQTKALVTDLTQYLSDRRYAVGCLHGDLDQTAREKTMRQFRDHKFKLLVCTDIASRGLDVKDITHVINYSVPRELDSYVHRIGRTARSGKAGFAMNLVTPSQRGLIGRIEKATQSKMKEGKIPTRKEIGEKKIRALLAAFQQQEHFTRACELMDPSWQEAIESMPSHEVAGRMLCLIFPEIFAEKPNSLSAHAPSPRGSRESRDHREPRERRNSREESDSRDSRKSKGARHSRDFRSSRRPEDAHSSKDAPFKSRDLSWGRKADRSQDRETYASQPRRAFEKRGPSSSAPQGDRNFRPSRPSGHKPAGKHKKFPTRPRTR